MSEFPPCLPCRVGQCAGCTEGLCGCIEAHEDDNDMMRGFKILKRRQREEARQQGPFSAIVHYGRWLMPDGSVQMTRLVTVPRDQKDRAEDDPKRASWPCR